MTFLMFKDAYYKAGDYKTKLQILTLFPSELTPTKIARYFGTTLYMAKKAIDLYETEGPLSVPNSYLGKPTSSLIIEQVHYIFDLLLNM